MLLHECVAVLKSGIALAAFRINSEAELLFVPWNMPRPYRTKIEYF